MTHIDWCCPGYLENRRQETIRRTQVTKLHKEFHEDKINFQVKTEKLYLDRVNIGSANKMNERLSQWIRPPNYHFIKYCPHPQF